MSKIKDWKVFCLETKCCIIQFFFFPGQVKNSMELFLLKKEEMRTYDSK